LAEPVAILRDLESRRRAAIRRTFTHFDPAATAAGFAAASGLIMTLVVMRHVFGTPPEEVQRIFGLLVHYLPGFDTEGLGLVVGVVDVAFMGAAFGACVAWCRNRALRIVLWRALRERDTFFRRHALDEIG
jgi:hypothetical protein